MQTLFLDSTILELLIRAKVPPIMVVQLVVSLFIAILFIQSGLDKVINWKGNVDYFKGHFKSSPLKNLVGGLMPIITLSELAAGFLSLIGIVIYASGGSRDVALVGMFLACLSIIQLFFGQRLAQDYAGAGVLVPYFIVSVIGLYLYTML